MFLDELTPLFKELAGHPVSFLGGFVSGILRLRLSDDPVKSWLDGQRGTTYTTSTIGVNNGNGRPQSISID